ncbi:MAG: hypothetical protein AB7K52_02690 [Phycisphaerales bacterium]
MGTSAGGRKGKGGASSRHGLMVGLAVVALVVAGAIVAYTVMSGPRPGDSLGPAEAVTTESAPETAVPAASGTNQQGTTRKTQSEPAYQGNRMVPTDGGG